MKTRDEIIQQSSALFLSRGFRKLKVDEISEELGISKKTLYKYFGNKENLIRECLDYEYKEIINQAKEIEEKSANAVEAIYTIVSEFYSKINIPQDEQNFAELKKYYPSIFEEHKKYIFKIIFTVVKSNFIRGAEEKYYINYYLPEYVARLVSQTYITNRTTFIDKSYDVDSTLMAKNSIEILVRGTCLEKGRTLFNSLLPFNLKMKDV